MSAATQKSKTTSAKPKQSAELTAAKKALDAAFKSAEFITAEALADIVGRKGKALRAHLRATKARPASEKNNGWKISRQLADETVANYIK